MADEEAANGEILAMLPLPGSRMSMVWAADEAHAHELLALSPEALAATVMQAATGAVAAGSARCAA